MLNVKVRYFAILREQTGLAEESLETSSKTAGGLYLELQVKHAFTVPLSAIRSSVNAEFVAHDRALSDGDEVVFVPPVAGG